MEIVCFHNPDEENGFLSNWCYSPFSVGEHEFSCMEQFMMYRKAICFEDSITAEQILVATDAAYIKELGRKVSNYNENVWNGLRQLIVYEGLLAKFSQNEEFRNRLLSTGDAILAECAVKDCIWGIGLSMTDPDRFNITSWRGQNLLGYTLMMVRDKLK